MCEPLKIAVLGLVGSLLTAASPRGAGAAPGQSDSLPAMATLRVGARAGAAHDSNLYFNANTEGDRLALLGTSLDADFLPSDSVVLKGSYRADLESYDQQSSYSHAAQLLNLALGYRPSDLVYVSLHGGGEQAHFPSRSSYSFWGAFGKVAMRAEIGDATTLLTSYQLRFDRFPDNTLDNLSHHAMLAWEMAVADSADVHIPLRYEHTRYSERFLLTEAGEATGTHRTGHRWRVEPGITLFPTYGIRLVTTLRAEVNDSNDTYASAPPVADAGDPTTTSHGSFVRHYDSYNAGSIDLDLRWELDAPLVITLRAAAGGRAFSARPAFDADVLPTDEKQTDTWVSAAAALAWRLGLHFEVMVRYAYGRQWSNDPFWDFDHHRGLLMVSGWWEGES